MATISTADFKNGMGLKINGKYYTIVEFQHVKPGKGGAFVRYKIRDLKSGRVIDQTCNAGTKFENVQLITKEMQYLYRAARRPAPDVHRGRDHRDRPRLQG